jgi:hypothetical protein
MITQVFKANGSVQIEGTFRNGFGQDVSYTAWVDCHALESLVRKATRNTRRVAKHGPTTVAAQIKEPSK